MEGLTSLLDFSKINAMKENLNDFDAACSLSQGAKDELEKDELEWFSTRCHLYNSTSIKKRSSVMVLTTNASQSGWGVTFENQSTNGEWSMEEKKQHINWLELQIEFFRVLRISGKIFSRRYEPSRDSRESILGVFVC